MRAGTAFIIRKNYKSRIRDKGNAAHYDRMLLHESRVNENSDGKPDIELCVKAAFRTHCDWYSEVMEVVESAAELGKH